MKLTPEQQEPKTKQKIYKIRLMQYLEELTKVRLKLSNGIKPPTKGFVIF